MIPGGVNPMLLGGGGGFQISRSARLRAAASASLSRTPGSAGNRKTWTYSVWFKRGSVTGNGGLLSARVDANNYAALEFVGAELRYLQASGGTVTLNKKATAVFRDPTALQHAVVALDTDNATAEDRCRMYINGVRITSWSTSTNAASGLATGFINNTTAQNIGIDSSLFYFDGYVAEAVFIDGQALTPSAFGQYDASGNWQPKQYEGTYGSNGYRLDFADPTTTTTLALDRSGNGNNFTASGISLTAGATYDSMLDVPLGGGGSERGNYCSLNPLFMQGGAISNGNLRLGPGNVRGAGSVGISSGKWYWESSTNHPTYVMSSGLIKLGAANAEVLGFGDALSWGWYANSGQKWFNSSNTAWGSAFTSTADVLGVAFDADAGEISFYKNGVLQGGGPAFTGLTSGPYFPAIHSNDGTFIAYINFGQRPFAYTPPAGFKALHTGNLTSDAVTVSGSFTGNALADGPFIWMGGAPETLTINGNAVTWATHADRTAGGFKLRTSSSSYNSTGTNTWTATVLSPSSDSAFRKQLAKTN